MCYSGVCPYENYNGECCRPRTELCPDVEQQEQEEEDE